MSPTPFISSSPTRRLTSRAPASTCRAARRCIERRGMTSAEHNAEAARGGACASLAALEAAIRRDLEILDYPSKPWLVPTPRADGREVLDVAIVGGGHCGLTAAFALMRERVSRILVIDENPAGQEGPWQSYARMPDLRTRKSVTSTELGYPNLTFRAYFE